VLKPGSLVDDRYEILKEIGRGGMSIVYLAMDNRLNKSLVVKDIRKRANSDDQLLINSLVLEANMLKKLDHGSLPKIYDIIESEGDIYVVMDYIEGESLKEKVQREGTIAANLVVNWAEQLSDVLSYLHTRKPNAIIYRDMKPDNVMLTPEGKIKLIDFGIAREYKVDSSSDTTNLGTKSYAAPEQISGKQSDARTDIYSLGVTLYNLVTGKSLNEPPFELKPIRYWDPSLPEGLEHIILKCTKSEPNDRYQSCEELSYDLLNINKLTRGYKKKLMKSLALALVPFALFITFTTSTVVGYTGMKNEQFQDYMNLVNESSRSVINGDHSRAIELLELAIVEVDRRRPEAYINLLDLYINRDEADAGLAKIETFMRDNYGRINQNNEVLFKVGMTYFDLKRDYHTALTFFQKVNEKEIADVQYYKTLALTMGSMNIDYDEFSEYLLYFKEYNDTLPNGTKRIDNYNSLANIYISYKSQIPEANTHTIDVVETAKELLQRLGDETLQYRYEIDFEEKLAQAYHSRGVNSQDRASARDDFLQAIEHYYQLIDLEVTDAEEAYVKIGVIYTEMGDHFKAIEQFNSIINGNPNHLGAYVRLIDLLLDIEQSKSEDVKNYSEVKRKFEKASEISGAENNERFKKLKRRLTNFNIL
jgi:eukaryotic-like serine/threonine-protein kinase